MTAALTDEHTATIREAAFIDTERLGQFGSMLVSLHHDLDQKRFIDITSTTPRTYARFLETKIDQSTDIVLVAEIDATIVGYVYAAIEGPDYMSLRGPAGVVHDLFVDTAHRTQGIGRMLMKAVLAEIANRGSRRVVLSTASRNEMAQRLFLSMGFRPAMIEMTRELHQAGE
ncbi:GNAT family N-acetyltransferase [Agrobacterium fabrum]|uniref:GNAT family N-acetyltransferase n=1 Tax=Agrobacterium fabrum TaxID=1176649 RepID=UPI0021582CB4|nr:GNAT family N-acetyltransferase [Agrobacterium fabrum]MCR6727738.1 GNAT family N-acetyltransferase [Agrobacterium fabrum]